VEKILIVIPARNEEKTIGGVVKGVKRILPNSVPLVVIDECRDNTGRIAMREGALVLKLPISLGIGGAVKAGYRFGVERGFDVVIQVDGDGQHLPEEIPKILDPVLRKEVNLCIGSRFLESEGFLSTVPRRLGIRMFSTLASYLSGKRITDCTSGFRAVDKELLRFYSRYYPAEFPDAEAILMAIFSGFRMTEVPVLMHRREFGMSSIGIWKSLYYPLKVLVSIVVTALRKSPERQ
jgi:glycosyltransferase involved in cell wall biosynthesis